MAVYISFQVLCLIPDFILSACGFGYNPTLVLTLKKTVHRHVILQRLDCDKQIQIPYN